ncbi:MAG TPA: 30S ribosomal protein S4 [Planctomycetaceae bacterium]|nr:30S ribosomal protein S4 [Planctomycetaceae bacterium]
MGRYTGPVCRLCRREGLKLFLKSTRCDSPKCAVERKEYPPGMHTMKRRKSTDYALRLREKQKVKRYYGVYERQFRRLLKIAGRATGNTGSTLMSLLERRLDNVVHRLGFAGSRAQARQLVCHGHLRVNGHKVDIASYLVKAGDTITVKNRPKSLRFVKGQLEESKPSVPDFLSLIPGDIPEGKVLRLPEIGDVSLPVEPQLIIELVSK